VLKIGKAYIFFRLLNTSLDLILVLKKLFVLSGLNLVFSEDREWLFRGEFAGPKAKARLSRSRHGSSLRAASAASAQHDQPLVGTPGKIGIRRKRNSCIDGFSSYLLEKGWW
jgi:hypothetical protein